MPSTFRKVIVCGMIVPYIALFAYDVTHGRLKTGLAAGLLAVVQALIYW